MHILYIYSELTIKGGADKIIIEKANYLVRHGYEVTIVTEAQMGRPLAFPLDSSVKHIDMGLDFNPIMEKVSIAHSLFRNVQVDTDVMFISDFDLATIAKVPQKDLVSNVSISLDFANLRVLESVRDVGITEIYTTGGYAVGL